jgi:Flp pilus assembly pilin Flp
MFTDKPRWAARSLARSRRLNKSTRDERGVTIVEYALLIALIAVVAVGSLTLLGYAVSNKLTKAGNDVSVTVPSVTINPSAATTNTGNLITLTASLSGASPNAAGTISFYVLDQTGTPTTCTGGGWTSVGTNATVHSNGSYLSSYTPAAAGTYWWYASYSGDTSTNNKPANSACPSTNTVVTTAQPTLRIAQPPTPATTPEATAIAATSIAASFTGASSAADGTITFAVWYSFTPGSTTPPATCQTNSGFSGGGLWTQVGTATVSGNTTTQYSPSTGYTPAAEGDFFWYAAYASGNADDNPATSTCGAGMPFTQVTAAQPTLTLAVPGTAATNTRIRAANIGATLASSTNTATGTITWTIFGPSATAPGSCTTGGQTVGNVTLTAFNGGPGTYNPGGLGFTPTATGNYWWYATYAGDAANQPAHTTCGGAGTETIVDTNAPTLTLISGGPGIPTTDTANATVAAGNIEGTLARASNGATGSITFYVSGPTTDTTCPTPLPSGVVGTAAVTGNGNYHSGSSYALTTSGIYWWYGYFTPSGTDTADTPATSNCVSTIVQAQPTLTITAAPATGTAGTDIPATALSAQLAGATPGGNGDTIDFRVFGPSANAPTNCGAGNEVGENFQVNGNGIYSPLFSIWDPPSGGNYWWYATYNGDQYNQAANSTCVTGMKEMVVQYAPTLTLAGGAGGIPANATETTTVAAANIHAALAASNPTPPAAGLISFFVSNPTTDASCADVSSGNWNLVGDATNPASGNATYTSSSSYGPFTSNAVYYFWEATYTPAGSDNTDVAATSNCQRTAVQGPSPFTISVNGGTSATAVYPGTSATLAESGIPQGQTGTITFTSGATTLCTVFVAFETSCNPNNALPVAIYHINANYSGDALYAASAATNEPVTLTITQAPSPFSITVNGSATSATITQGQRAQLAENGLANDATGTVTFKSGATTLCTVNVAFADACNTSPALASGTYTVTATYSGDVNYAGSTATNTVTLDVLIATNFTIKVNNGATASIVSGQTATLSETGLPVTATGIVTFIGNPLFGPNVTLCTTTPATGSCTTSASLATGDYTVTAAYAGDATYGASNSTNNVTLDVVTATNFTIRVNGSAGPVTVTYDTPATMTEQGLPGFATGTITFSSGATTLCTFNVAFQNNCSITTPGSYIVTATYSGDGNYAGSTSTNTVTLTINKVVPNVNVGGNLRGSLTFTAAVTGPGGGAATPTGTVTWVITVSSGTAPTCGPSTLNFNGQGTCVITGPSAAVTYTAKATYVPGTDPNYLGATGTSPGTRG